MLKPLLGAVALYALTLGPAQAILLVTPGNIPQSDNNVINGGACAGFEGPGTAIEACFNGQNTPIVNISSDENIVYDAGGQAKVDPETDELSRLTISVDGLQILTLILNIQIPDLLRGNPIDGYVRFTDGTTISPVQTLDGSGNNFFTITGGPFPFISYTTFSDLAAATEADIVESTRQIRIGTQEVTQIPEPATLGVLAVSLLGLGLAVRRRRR